VQGDIFARQAVIVRGACMDRNIIRSYLYKERKMTWTAILYNGDVYIKQTFYGANDSQRALNEAQEKFGRFWPPGVSVVALVPGDHPVYLNEPATLPKKQEQERREL